MNTTDIKRAVKADIRKLIAAFMWLFVSCEDTTAQVFVGKSIDSLVLPYPFIRKDLNVINNDSAALAEFYVKLWELQTGKRDRVTVVHIGDSHIQADFFSGVMRQNLQLQFGNAGRGTVFPYRTAKSNEPYSYKTFTTSDWTFKRNVFYNQPLPIGLAGYTVQAADTNASILLSVKDQPGLDYSFTKFTLFHSKGDSMYDFAVCDEFNCRLGYFNATEGDSFTSVLNFEKPMHSIMLDCMPHDTTGKKVQIYGMLLENNQKGILYNTIGVNGAMYMHYNKSQYFIDQLAYLKPDLVIISLGTNEGYYPGFKSEGMYANMDTLITNIAKVAPQTKFLLSTPGDSFRRTKNGRVKNPDIRESRNTVIRYAGEHQLAYWDLWGVMGGYGSMAKWYVSGLASKDRVHFSRKGYELQGELMYNALMKGYENFVIRTYGRK
ncbi:MAG: GDSL-type esterase/lipase family protein [Bacteroidia bacterium]